MISFDIIFLCDYYQNFRGNPLIIIGVFAGSEENSS